MVAARIVSKAKLIETPYLEWNEYIDLLAMSEYADLNPIQKIAHLVFWYDSEVQNGGHMQYFANHNYEHIKEAISSLKSIGASEFSKLLQKACTLYESKNRNEIINVNEYVELALEGEYDERDSSFYDMAKELSVYLEEYLLENKSSFIEII